MDGRRTPTEARDDLGVWRGSFPVDPHGGDLHLAAVNRRYLTPDRLAAIEREAGRFGRRIGSELAPLVAGYQANPPRLEAHDGIGRPLMEVRFDGDYHRAGDLVWSSGILAHSRTAGRSFEHANLAYLASLEGEMGHMCAVTCTTGLVRVLRWAGAEDLLGRYLDGLASPGPGALRGAQFLTEVQGGSDVGANTVTARPAADGTWRLDGEKWFCSVADADLFLVMGRVSGETGSTSGLGCFLVPRLVDGVPNGFTIRRLKDKLGTTSMASGEFEFHGAVGHAVGDPTDGFRLMVGAMLNASRWMNALGNLGVMRRAYLEAAAYARFRHAFGGPISRFPAVLQTLAAIKVEWLAALHSTWELTALDEAVDITACAPAGSLGSDGVTEADAGFHRFLVNANKLVTSQACTDVVRAAIEVLGGNGAIESFSVLPRLLRDSVVYEQWEGTHNVLAAQVARDLPRFDLLPIIAERTERLLGDDQGSGLIRAAGAEVVDDARRCLATPETAAWHFRSVLVRMVRIHQAALMTATAVEQPERADELEAAAALLVARHVRTGYRPQDDPAYPKLIAAVLGPDLDEAVRG